MELGKVLESGGFRPRHFTFKSIESSRTRELLDQEGLMGRKDLVVCLFVNLKGKGIPGHLIRVFHKRLIQGFQA